MSSQKRWGKGKSDGWASFDYKQRRQQDLEPEHEDDPFPPITSLASCQNVMQANALQISERSFSSVAALSARGAQDYKESFNSTDSSCSSDIKVFEVNNYAQNLVKLKDMHCWADDNLIEDVMVAVDNDPGKASAILSEMVSTEGKANVVKLSPENLSLDNKNQSDSDDIMVAVDDNPIKASALLSEMVSTDWKTNVVKLSSSANPSFDNKNLPNPDEYGSLMNKTLSIDEYVSCNQMLPDDAVDSKFDMRKIISVPVEPEWEEDDIYLSQRKDAIRMKRAASQHSKAATNAFMRGDHFFAQQLSLRAQDEWIAAENLNAKAAREILAIRNSQNNMWKLDLHGLHAVEAVSAVQERLKKLEVHLSLSRSVSPYRVKRTTGMVRSSSVESLKFMDNKKLDKNEASARERPTFLQVITGVGNHSRGRAALPLAVRSFLAENGYHFNEARPGLISVRPKYRLQSQMCQSS